MFHAMNTIYLDDIIVPEHRQRRIFDKKDLEELASSIAAKGLFHPVVLRNDGQTLVSGERRLRALQLLASTNTPFAHNGVVMKEGKVPFVFLGDLSEVEIEEAELEENVLRVDLSWQEHAAAVSRLHELRNARDPNWTAKATASELLGKPASGYQVQSNVQENIVLAKHLDDPEVAAAKTKKEAVKIIKRKAESLLREKLAEQFEMEATDHEFHLGRFQDYLPAPSSVDIILTDPPYGIDANSFGDMAGATHEYEDDPETWRRTIEDFLRSTLHVTKPQAHIYIFCDPRNFGHFFSFFDGQPGFYAWPTPLIWDKGNQGMLPRPEHGPRRCYETIFYAIRGDKRATSVYRDVISIPGLQSPVFGAEKPVGLYENLLARSATPGDLIWDPFAGAGPIFPAANRFSCLVHASELIPDKYNFAKMRMTEEEPCS